MIIHALVNLLYSNKFYMKACGQKKILADLLLHLKVYCSQKIQPQI